MTTTKLRTTAEVGKDIQTAYDNSLYAIREAAADRVREDYLALLRENARLQDIIRVTRAALSPFETGVGN
jgi:hypothetical protein